MTFSSIVTNDFSNLTGFLICCIVFAITFKAFERHNRLSHIPGPWYCRISSLVLTYHELVGGRTRWIHALHQKFGPVVRIAGNEVHFNDWNSIKTIYGVGSPAQKDHYYQEFSRSGIDSTFSTCDSRSHADKRRCLASFYSTSHLRTEAIQQLLEAKVDELCCMIEESFNQSIDMHLLFSYYTLDVISALVYGAEKGSNALSGNWASQEQVKAEIKSPRNWTRLWRKTGQLWIWHLARWLDALSWKANPVGEAVGRVDDYIAIRSRELADANRTDAIEDRSDADQDRTLVGRLLSRGRDLKYVVVESRVHVIAGANTTTTVLTFLMAHLARNPSVVKGIRSSLMNDLISAQDCPLLDAIIMEALRLWSAIPMTLPRLCSNAIVISGFRIPENTKVGAQAYSIHRDPIMFPDPEEFKSDRWRQQHRPRLWSFSSGPRSCIGQNLAILQMKLVMSRIIKKYDFECSNKTMHNISPSERTANFIMLPNPRSFMMKFTEYNR